MFSLSLSIFGFVVLYLLFFFFSFCCFFFFFFQAEDGIRDRDVTGVQTCALPISFWSAVRTAAICDIIFACETSSSIWVFARASAAARTAASSKVPLIGSGSLSCTRSEERRVGKECRSRWSPEH